MLFRSGMSLEGVDPGLIKAAGDPQYNVVELLDMANEADLRLVFGDETVDNARELQTSLAILAPFKEGEGYNLVKAKMEGVESETIRELGFSEDAIHEAEKISERTPTWGEYKAIYGTSEGAEQSWWNPIQFVEGVITNLELSKQNEDLYDEYIEKYGVGNFVASAYQQFAVELAPASRVFRSDVEMQIGRAHV